MNDRNLRIEAERWEQERRELHDPFALDAIWFAALVIVGLAIGTALLGWLFLKGVR